MDPGFTLDHAHLWYVVVAFLSLPLIFISQPFSGGSGRSITLDQLYIAIVFGVFAFIFAFRSASVGLDTSIYTYTFDQMAAGSLELHWLNRTDSVFHYVMWACSSVMPLRGFFFLTVLIYLGGLSFWLRSLKHYQTWLLAFGYCSCFFFYTLGTNIVKTSVALGLVFFGMAATRKPVKIVLFVLACAIHFSFTSVLVVAGLSMRIASLRLLFGLWCLAVTGAGFGIDLHGFIGALPSNLGENLFGVEKVFGYYYSDEGYLMYRSGFRWDFLVFNAVFMVVSFIWIRSSGRLSDAVYLRFVRAYLGLSIFTALLIRFPYVDRIAVFSWLLIPILVYGPASRVNAVSLPIQVARFASFVAIFAGFWSFEKLRLVLVR